MTDSFSSFLSINFYHSLGESPQKKLTLIHMNGREHFLKHSWKTGDCEPAAAAVTDDCKKNWSRMPEVCPRLLETMSNCTIIPVYSRFLVLHLRCGLFKVSVPSVVLFNLWRGGMLWILACSYRRCFALLNSTKTSIVASMTSVQRNLFKMDLLTESKIKHSGLCVNINDLWNEKESMRSNVNCFIIGCGPILNAIKLLEKKELVWVCEHPIWNSNLNFKQCCWFTCSSVCMDNKHGLHPVLGIEGGKIAIQDSSPQNEQELY